MKKLVQILRESEHDVNGERYDGDRASMAQPKNDHKHFIHMFDTDFNNSFWYTLSLQRLFLFCKPN
jgi:hypothetical protein